jgi:uncharacterized membrane protein
MSKTVIAFINIVLAAVLTGTMVGIWIGYNPMELSSGTYIEQQQNMIRQLNTLMPALGLLTIILTVTSAFFHKQNKIKFTALLVAALLLVISGLITRFGNQPINEIVMTWPIDVPPSDWSEHRDRWWSLHILRTITAVCAFLIITLSVLYNKEIIKTADKKGIS